MGTLKVGNYELVKLLGEGGMGSVYEGHHLESKERVAIKLINADVAAHSTVLARFEIEARAAASIQSPYVCKVLDFGREQGAPFLVMELLEGKDLETVFAEQRILPPELVIRFATQCCLGLQQAHERGIVHRDIKPANLILAEHAASKDWVLKVLDFGIAKVRADDWQALAEEPLTRTGSLLGSPRYMSPEQARGYKNIDQRTDLFSLATVMYQGLAGHTPHHQVEAMGDLIVTLCSDPSPLLRTKAPWIDPRLERIVARALAINVTDRYQSAAEMAKDLTELVPEATRIPRALLRTFEPPLAAIASTLPNPGALPKVPDAPSPALATGPSAPPTQATPVATPAKVEAAEQPVLPLSTLVSANPQPTPTAGSLARTTHPDEDARDGSDAFPVAWAAAGILLSLAVGIGSVAAGVIPLPSRSSSTSEASASPSSASWTVTSTTSTAPARSAEPKAPASAPPEPAAPPPSSLPSAAALASAKPALTGHLPSAPSAAPIVSSVPKVNPPTTSSPVVTAPPTASPFPSDSPL